MLYMETYEVSCAIINVKVHDRDSYMKKDDMSYSNKKSLRISANSLEELEDDLSEAFAGLLVKKL